MAVDSGRIAPFSYLGNEDFERWTASVRAGARTEPEASPAYSRHLADAGEDIWVWSNSTSWAPFVRGDGMLTAICPRTPSVSQAAGTSDVAEIASCAAQTEENIYLPLVDRRSVTDADRLGLTSWERRGNPVIAWSTRDESMFERAVRRGSNQVARKRRRLENEGYLLDQKRHGAGAADRMLSVDGRSWKVARGQSMQQRGSQAAFYASLIRSGEATATFVEYQGTPIAFRLDAAVGDTVSCLKWSYDERHARVSPGQYLLTHGLDVDWGDGDISRIDLHGGPDSLKRLIWTDVEPRFDIWIGERAAGDALRINRTLLDRGVAAIMTDGRGLRHAY